MNSLTLEEVILDFFPFLITNKIIRYVSLAIRKNKYSESDEVILENFTFLVAKNIIRYVEISNKLDHSIKWKLVLIEINNRISLSRAPIQSLRVYATNYNFIRIASGMGGMCFSN